MAVEMGVLQEGAMAALTATVEDPPVVFLSDQRLIGPDWHPTHGVCGGLGPDQILLCDNCFSDCC